MIAKEATIKKLKSQYWPRYDYLGKLHPVRRERLSEAKWKYENQISKCSNASELQSILDRACEVFDNI